jgi:hypothetical protein
MRIDKKIEKYLKENTINDTIKYFVDVMGAKIVKRNLNGYTVLEWEKNDNKKSYLLIDNKGNIYSNSKPTDKGMEPIETKSLEYKILKRDMEDFIKTI